MRTNSLADEHKAALRAAFDANADAGGLLPISRLGDALVLVGASYGTAGPSTTGKLLSFSDFSEVFEEAKLREVFDDIDVDRSGAIDQDELRQALRALGFSASRQDVLRMLHTADRDDDKKVDFAEFRACFRGLPLTSLESIAKRWAQLSAVEVGDLAPPLPPSGVPFFVFLMAGGAAGVSARTVTAPLEKESQNVAFFLPAAKIVAQTSRGGVNALEELAFIYRTGGLRALYAGNLANCIRTFPYLGITTGVYRELLKFTPADDELDAMEPLYRGACAAVAGLVGQVFTYPMDVVRAKLTLEDGTGRFTIAKVCREIYAKEGIPGLYRGFYPTCMAIAPFLAIQLPTLDLLKCAAADRGIPIDTMFLLTGGALAGALAHTVVYPLDVLRRRLQVGGAASVNVVADNTWLALRSLAQREGLGSLFAGILPTYAKVVPATATSMTVCNLLVARYQEQSRCER